ncbi:nucleoside deaminase [Hymenobacter sp. UV11]|uniref:nucleoside deaminase n=1 Tax=Hymenobacter sp. UV11 TaxID=1849735 RepID=UPI00105FC954|nr:nucleoside deaminase [Hymenobacter sp. UV11]TDN37643.1 tRNA-specific adenosine deaminase [Hymenobacter sp. UV11]TFZ68841.1 nucleoside deaminase [Hymenobacter sp. UV11]
MDTFMQAAIDEARQGRREGGIPIGSVLRRGDDIVGRGHNKRVQDLDPIAHGEMDALRNAGRQRTYRDTVLYTTLMPCYMCAGTIVQFKIPKVVVGEAQTFGESLEFLQAHGVEVEILNSPECIELMREFIEAEPALWNEDIMEL